MIEFDIEDVLFHAILISDIFDQSECINKDFVYQDFKALMS